MTPTTLPTRSTSTRQVLLAGAIAAALTGAVNAGIALAAVALGVPPAPQLTPAADVLFSVVASVIGAVGWQIVRSRAGHARRTLTWLVPTVLAVSFVPDVLLGVATAADTGIEPVLALALMHVTTISIAVAVYGRLLPVAHPGLVPAAPTAA